MIETVAKPSCFFYSDLESLSPNNNEYFVAGYLMWIYLKFPSIFSFATSTQFPAADKSAGIYASYWIGLWGTIFLKSAG